MGAAQNTGPVKVAIAGLGRAGWSIHAMGLKGRQDFQVVAAIDKQPERRAEAEQTFPGCKGYEEWKDFLANPNGAELAIIATQSVAHGPMSIEALKTGLHVLVEKPMAMNVKEADQMIAAAKKAKRILSIHQNYRAHPEFNHLKSIVESGILGKIVELKNSSVHFARRNDWQTLRKYGGGTLNNTCPHTIDQCLQLLGSPVMDVWGDLQKTITSGNAEDHVKVLIRGKNGAVVDMEVTSCCAVKQPQWLIMGTLCTLVREGDEFVIRYLDPAKLPPLKVVDSIAVPDRKYGVIGGETLEWQEKKVQAADPAYKLDFYGCLYDSIRNKKKLLVTPESVREVIRVIALSRKGTKFP
ncbi:MAG: Gfo/Idh/MocA family oxidoreductase [Planctomycetes bacterium]|nr:Gfo/Idh/MocA family oxidoreductase [Planctomycetota bacterium]